MNLFQICSICLYIAFIVHSFCISFKPILKLLQNPSLNTVAMAASSSNPKKRVKQIVSSTRFVDTRGHLEGWFASVHDLESVESIDKYLREISRRIINIPKFVRLDWLKFKILLEVSELM